MKNWILVSVEKNGNTMISIEKKEKKEIKGILLSRAEKWIENPEINERKYYSSRDKGKRTRLELKKDGMIFLAETEGEVSYCRNPLIIMNDPRPEEKKWTAFLLDNEGVPVVMRIIGTEECVENFILSTCVCGNDFGINPEKIKKKKIGKGKTVIWAQENNRMIVAQQD